jgi:hypothetical protein
VESRHETRWNDVITVLQQLERIPHEDGCNRLTAYIEQEAWLVNSPPNFFYTAAIAAKHTGNLCQHV